MWALALSGFPDISSGITAHEEYRMNRTKKASSDKLPTKPFFVRFLERQSLQDVTAGVNDPPHTLKFPSDSDEV